MKYVLIAWSLSCLVIAFAACGGRTTGQQSAFELGAKSAPPERSSAFTIQARDQVDEGDRKRVRAKVILAEGLDTDKSIEAIRGAIQELLPADGEIQVVEVLAYKSDSEIAGDWTVGHAFASKDGKGWSGDGTFGGGVFDRNNIELELKLESGQEHFSVAR